jgi:hypothetical protein
MKKPPVKTRRKKEKKKIFFFMLGLYYCPDPVVVSPDAVSDSTYPFDDPVHAVVFVFVFVAGAGTPVTTHDSVL